MIPLKIFSCINSLFCGNSPSFLKTSPTKEGVFSAFHLEIIHTLPIFFQHPRPTQNCSENILNCRLRQFKASNIVFMWLRCYKIASRASISGKN